MALQSWQIALIEFVGLGLVTAVVVVIFMMMKKKESPLTPSDSSKSPESSEPPSSGSSGSSGSSKPGVSFQIHPKDYDKRIEHWDDAWRFPQYDRGTVEFDVMKESGLIVALSNTMGYPKGGYAVILDQRGSGDTQLSDSSTSNSYISRLPQINGAASAHANVRNVELSGTPRHIKVTYEHGDIRVYVNNQMVLAYRDPAPDMKVQYVAFGHTGLKSGVGYIENMKIY